MSKTMQDLELELDEATNTGDLDAVDRIYSEMETLEGGGAIAAKDVAESDGVGDDPELNADGSSASKQDDDTVDGKGDDRLVPLKEAKTARQEAAKYREEAETLKQQLEEMRSNPQVDPVVAAELDRLTRLTKVYEDQFTKHDLKPATLPEEFKLDAERLVELEGYGDLGEVVAMLARQSEFLSSQIRANATKQAEAPAKEDDDPRTAAINTDGDLKRWNQSELAWSEVQKVDAYLATLPEFSGKPLSARIPKLKEMVKTRLGEPAGDPPPSNKSGKPDITERLPTSLTDIGGAAPNAEASFEDRFKDKSEIDMLPEIEKLLKSGKSIDDILEAGHTGIL